MMDKVQKPNISENHLTTWRYIAEDTTLLNALFLSTPIFIFPSEIYYVYISKYFLYVGGS
jgi:hypothetical protein